MMLKQQCRCALSLIMPLLSTWYHCKAVGTL